MPTQGTVGEHRHVGDDVREVARHFLLPSAEAASVGDRRAGSHGGERADHHAQGCEVDSAISRGGRDRPPDRLAGQVVGAGERLHVIRVVVEHASKVAGTSVQIRCQPHRGHTQRSFAALKQWRGLATRYDKLAISASPVWTARGLPDPNIGPIVPKHSPASLQRVGPPSATTHIPGADS